MRASVPVPALVPLRRTGGDATLFVVTAGYGDLMALTQLARLLTSDVAVYALQPPMPRAGPLIAAYVAAIRGIRPAGPYRLLGYSTGGLAAFAVAQELVTSAERIGFLGLVDAPCGGSRVAAWAHRAARGVLGRWLMRLGPRLGQPGRVAARLLADPGLAAQVDALVDYRPTRYSGGVITTYLPEDPAWARRFQQVDRWRKVAGGGLKVVRVPGTHDTCLRPPHVRALAASLDRVLAPS